jgi:hypothetical protein
MNKENFTVSRSYWASHTCLLDHDRAKQGAFLGIKADYDEIFYLEAQLEFIKGLKAMDDKINYNLAILDLEKKIKKFARKHDIRVKPLAKLCEKFNI